MKRLLFFTFVYFIFLFHLSAQAAIQPEVKSGLVHNMGQYRFPDFKEGTIVFRNGMILSEKLNYNISTDEMHFIDKGGDTLAIAAPATIHFISMNGSRFYYDKGYLQAVDTVKGIILAFRQHLEEDKKPGAELISLRSNEWVAPIVSDKGETDKSDRSEKISLDARESYFFGDGYGNFTKAGKDYIYNHFKEHQGDIKAFLKANHTSFNELGDLLVLLQFCRKW